MIESNIQHSDLVAIETSLADYLESDETDFSGIITQAKQIIEQEFRNRGRKLRNFCKRLELQSSDSFTTSDTGDKSDEDIVERTRLVVVISANSGSSTWTLQGTNDSTSETWTTITTTTSTTATSKYVVFSDTYKYYRLNWSGTSTTYSAYLVERSFEFAHIYLTLSMIYNKLRSQLSDLWKEKKEEYFQSYQNEIDVLISSYDENEDEQITSGEEREIVRASFSR